MIDLLEVLLKAEAAVLQAGRQAGKLTSDGEFVDQHQDGESAVSASSTSRVRSSAQPIPRREKASKITARDTRTGRLKVLAAPIQCISNQTRRSI